MASRGGGGGGGGGGGHGQLLCRERSASFHGRSSSTTAAGSEPRLQMMRRPKTHPDLLGPGSGVRLYSSSAAAAAVSSSSTDDERRGRRRVPAKVVVNVTVQRSLLGPLQVMASTEWTVEKLVEEALKQYRKEGRRPLLITTTTTTTTVLDPSAFGLHYSQFTLQSLDPKEKLIGLGSRNFFLCPKQKQPPSPAAAAAAADTDTAAAAAPTSSSSSSSSSSSCSGEAHDKTSKITIPWLRFMDFLL